MRINRFVDTTAPAEGSSQGGELQALEKKYSLDQAVSLFKKERNESALLRNACNLAESLLSSGKVGQNLGNLSSLNYDSKVAIVALDFNSRSRNLSTSSWNSFPYKGMWLLLNKAILSHGNLSSSLTVYRGIGTLINAAPNTAFCFRQIASTSSNGVVSLQFASGQGTLFILKIKRGLCIRALSQYPSEDEYILPAFDLFVVTKMETTDGCRKIYLQA